MYKIATLNKISPVGLERFTGCYSITDDPQTAEGIIVRSHPMHDMDFPDDLMAIARAGAGVNNIPTEKCAEKGIVVFNTPGANANSVKELVLCGMIMAARNIPAGIKWVRTLSEDVSKSVEKGKSSFAGTEIKGKTLGVIGLGSIGVLVANAAQKLGMKVVGYDPYITLKAAHELSHKIPVVNDLITLLPTCDYVTIHVPVTEDTKDMIDDKCFDHMKDGAVLLNFARDKIVEDDAFVKAINSSKLKYYVSDFPNDKVIDNDKIILIPHLGASTKEAEDNCAVMAADQLMDYIENGNITNSVNYPSCSLGRLDKDATARVCILNKNIPAMLGKITGIMADKNINIRNLTNKSKDDYACTLMDIDAHVTEYALEKALDVEGIIRIRVIKQ
ncbi:MAG: 3-phosphoglycerate dehydrogenase [Clostridiales bacterium]|nr:3-phosphoglycerate dehydrogenase [Clostridiales bacterium]